MTLRKQVSIDELTVEDTTDAFYHSGKGRRTRDVPLEHRTIIAWDGEGMRLSGENKPQHYVMFGCSADIDGVLIDTDLDTVTLCRYITKIGAMYPSAVHVGYGFRYDMNMIVKSLPVYKLHELRTNNETYFDDGDDRYRIAWLPGKRLTITRRHGKNKRDAVTVRIDDIVSFFAAPFIGAIESVLKDELTDDDRAVIAHGKEQRGDTHWSDIPEVLRYWTAEIRLMERLAEKFRETMYSAGFMLRDWYGPGALSSYLIRTRGLREHIVNGPPDLPSGVHTASKHAYAGGRFELFRFGRVEGPVYGLDINSAYPYAMSKAPSLGADHGFWQWTPTPTEVSFFGCYLIRFRGVDTNPFERRAMPLFHRDDKGSITYPPVTTGWYWSPEASAVIGRPGVEVLEGWEWISDGNRPFLFLQEMFDERLRIGKKNVLSMPYKLGPNSMYGKFAQRVGHRDGLAPRSHCLPLAGWVTSYCRAMLFNVMRQIPPSRLIAVETDGVYTTHDPAKLRGVQFGDRLGDWGIDRYDEMMYVQNGVYHRRDGDRWLSAKSRGLDVASVSLDVVTDYLKRCEAGTFPTLTVNMRDRFVGLTAAAASAAPLKTRHCRWEGGSRELAPGGKGKRMHVPAACPACIRGESAWESQHSLVIRSRSVGQMSHPHFLPWEDGEELPDAARARELDGIAEDLSYA